VAPTAGCAATEPGGPTHDLGQSPLRVHRTTAWDGQALAIGAGAFTLFRDAYDNLNESVEK
jgi:hypothetical protein